MSIFDLAKQAYLDISSTDINEDSWTMPKLPTVSYSQQQPQNTPVLTRIIWLYWHQGWGKAPSIVKKCRRSWELHNPEFDIRFLDRNTVMGYLPANCGIDFKRKDVDLVKWTNLIRLNLLAEHGGIWVDATLMCMKPVVSWLIDYYESQVFVFKDPGRDRMLSSWFIAAEPNNLLIVKFHNQYRHYLMENTFPYQKSKSGKILRSILERSWGKSIKKTTRWHTWAARTLLGFYPYFIFHYTFNKLIIENNKCREIFQEIKYYPAEPLLSINQSANKPDSKEKVVEKILQDDHPMYKLDWRANETNPFWAMILKAMAEKSALLPIRH